MTRFPRLCWFASAALIGALVIATADAQPPGGGRRPGGRRPGGFMGGPGGPGMMRMRGGGGLAGLLRSPQVQEELKLSEAQGEKLRDLNEKVMEEIRDLLPDRESLRDLSQEERREQMQKAMEKFQQEAEKRAPEVEKQIAEILDKAQFKRLKQLEVQRQGVDALRRPDIVQALGLTEEQQKQIKEALEDRDKKREELGEQMRAMFEGGFRQMSQEEREKAREKMQEAREKGRTIQSEAQKKAMGVLTDEQKARMPNLMGEPFEFRRFDSRRRPGEGRRDGDRPRRPRGER